VSGLLYLVACLVPAVTVHDTWPSREVEYRGYEALLSGFLLPSGLAGWSANGVLLAGWLLLLIRQHAAAATAGYLATLLALTVWLTHDPVNPSGQEQVTRLHVGYYFWQASTVALFLGGGFLVFHQAWARARERGREIAGPWLDFALFLGGFGLVALAPVALAMADTPFVPNRKFTFLVGLSLAGMGGIPVAFVLVWRRADRRARWLAGTGQTDLDRFALSRQARRKAINGQ
jgi:hypothetical protein